MALKLRQKLNLARWQAGPDPEIRLRAGDKQAIAARLQRCLQELERFQLEL